MIFRLVLFLAALCFGGCEFPWGAHDPVVARVGNSMLKLSDFKRMTADLGSLDEKQKAQVLESWANREVIFLEALESGIEKEEAVRLLLESARRKIIVDSYLNRADTFAVSESEVRRFYDNHTDLFLRGDWAFSGVIIDYKDWRSADAYFRKNKDEDFKQMPHMNAAFKNVAAFDSLNGSPDSCAVEDLRTFPLGKLSRPKLCKGVLKSVLLTERLDSAVLFPFSEVYSLAYSLSAEEAYRVHLDRIRDKAKNKHPVFFYPDKLR
ncbi:MAG: hypothetical protein LBR60_02000 [Fibrobacter sp.]|nr:hypothetical protein [Fibrobacter sp.]